MVKAVFLDRDGTLNWDPGYLSDADKLELLPGVGKGLSALSKAGYQLIVVTNQSGLGRGYLTLEDLHGIHCRMNELLEPFETQIDAFYFCPHLPSDRCRCRKPQPQMILDAANDHDIDLEWSVIVGDKRSDLAAGKKAGCARGALIHGFMDDDTELDKLKKGEADMVAVSVSEVAEWILEHAFYHKKNANS